MLQFLNKIGINSKNIEEYLSAMFLFHISGVIYSCVSFPEPTSSGTNCC